MATFVVAAVFTLSGAGTTAGAVSVSPTGVDLSFPAMGLPQSYTFSVSGTSIGIQIPVPAGLRPDILTATLVIPPNFGTGVLVAQSGTTYVGSFGLPPASPSQQVVPVVLPLAGVQVSDRFATFSLTLEQTGALAGIYDATVPNAAGILGSLTCSGPSPLPLHLINPAIAYVGSFTPSTSIATFFPTVARQLIIYVPPTTTPAEQTTALHLAAEAAHAYGLVPVAITARAWNGASLPPAPANPLDRAVYIHESSTTGLDVVAPTLLEVSGNAQTLPEQNAALAAAFTSLLQAPAVSVRPTFTSSVSGSVFFAPGDIKTVYDVNPVLANYNGTGQSIAIMGQSSIVPSDITNFQVASGLTPKAPTLVLVPGSGSPTVYSGDESESDLDLEWSGAMAPGANIILVYTGNSANSGGIWDSMAYAVDERLANIISVSYATCEPELGTFTLEPIFQQAAAQGQTIFAASGDQGSTSCSDPISTTIPLSTQQALAVNYPASSPYVTGVGGTEVSQTNAAYYTQGQGYWTAQNTSADVTTSALKYIPEVAWNDDASSGQASAANGGGLSATGGGASTLFTKPAWQTGVPGIPSDGKRDVPDVALYSSPAFVPYLLCSSDQSMWQSASINGPAQAASCSGGTFRDTVSGGSYLTAAGGTSFATPIFAGMVALINQQKGYVTGQGLINPSLYTLASNSTTYKSAFNDITSGNNYCTAGTTFGYCSSSGSTEGYAAGAAYDLVTGLGSVDLSNLATAWSKNAGTSASLTSSTTTVSASNGAPNVGASVTFTITVAPSTGTGIPTGTVNLSIDGGGTSFSNGGTTATATLTSNGTATYATSFSTAGTHEVVAQYAGDSTFAASTGTASVAVAAVNSGTGTFKMAATAVTVAQGSSSSSTITVTPAGGYTGTVDIGFSTSNDTALTNLCYSFTTMLTSGDGSVAVTGTAAATTQLTLDTNAADCVSPTGASQKGWRRLNAIRSGNSSRNTGTNPAPAAFAFAGLLLAGFLGRSSRKLRNLACVIALVAAGFAVTACGSSSVNSTVQNPPKGTYTFTLTGTDTATATNTATTTFTFTIN